MNLHMFSVPRSFGVGSEGKQKLKNALRHFSRLLTCLIISVGAVAMMETLAGNSGPSSFSGFAIGSGFLFFLGWELFEGLGFSLDTNPKKSKPRL